MQRSRVNLNNFLIVPFLLLMMACGDSDQVTVTVQAINKTNFTLQGKVIIDNAAITTTNVVVSIDNLSFNTTSNAQGEYSIEVEVDASYNNKIVTISANGTGDQAYVKLISSGFDVQAFINSLGGNSFVNSAEHIGVNVTYVSTAMAALARIENDGVLPLSQEAFTEKLMSQHIIISEVNVRDMATAAKLAIEQSASEARFKLPSGTSDTFELLSSPELLIAYLHNIRLVSELEQKRVTAQQAIIQSTINKNVIPVMPEFYTANLDNWVEDEFSIRSDNPFFQFNQDGTGIFRVKKSENNFTWVNGSSLKITFDNAVIDTYEVDNGLQIPKIQRQSIYDSIELSLTASTHGTDLVRYQVNWHHHFPNNENPDATQKAYDSLIFVHKKYTPLTAEEIVGDRAIPLYADIVGPEYNETPSLDSGSFSFSEDGSVLFNKPASIQTDIDLDSGTWMLTEDGALMLTLNEAKLEVRRLYGNHFSVHTMDLNNQYLGHNLDFSEVRDANTMWTAENVVGLYDFYPEEYFPVYIDTYLLRLNIDGTGVYTEGDDDNGDGVVDESEYYTEVLTWELIDNQLVIRSPNLTEGGDRWIRRFDLFKVENNRYHLIEWYQYGIDSLGEPRTEWLEYSYLTKLPEP